MSTLSSISNAANLELRPVAGSIGAQVDGIRLSSDLPSEQVAAVRRALCHYKVLFFREQGHLDDQEHEAFAKLFGEILNHPTVPVAPGTRHITELDSRRNERANFWHTDITYTDTPALASFLRAVIVPEFGGDTVWANCVTAYERLPADLKEFADKKRVVHGNVREDVDYLTEARSMMNSFTSIIYEAEHPLVRVHPETGERAILLGNYGHKFIGHSGLESQSLFRIFQDAVTQPENTVRWRWRSGDMAIWDNRSTQHYAIADYGDETRVMRRVTLVGDVPVGVDGQRSRLLTKRPNPAQLQAA